MQPGVIIVFWIRTGAAETGEDDWSLDLAGDNAVRTQDEFAAELAGNDPLRAVELENQLELGSGFQRRDDFERKALKNVRPRPSSSPSGSAPAANRWAARYSAATRVSGEAVSRPFIRSEARNRRWPPISLG